MEGFIIRDIGPKSAGLPQTSTHKDTN